jgi:hypothetical protein
MPQLLYKSGGGLSSGIVPILESGEASVLFIQGLYISLLAKHFIIESQLLVYHQGWRPLPSALLQAQKA